MKLAIFRLYKQQKGFSTFEKSKFIQNLITVCLKCGKLKMSEIEFLKNIQKYEQVVKLIPKLLTFR